MARRSDRKKTVLAVAVLGLGLTVAVPRIVPFGEGPVVIEDGILFPEEDEPAAAAGGGTVARAGGLRADLLAAFGSWPPDAPVRRAFGEPGEVPGEALLPDGPRGDGPVVAPPRHLVSMVLLTQPASRAVVDTSIVAVGDVIEAGTVAAIHAGGIVVDGPHGPLDYDLGVAGARGYEDWSAGAAPGADPDDDSWMDEAAMSGAGGRLGRSDETVLGGTDAALLQALEDGLLGVEDGGDLPQGDGR